MCVQDAEAHGGGKNIAANISMLERNKLFPERGEVLLRYVAATTEDADFLLGKIQFKDMTGIRYVLLLLLFLLVSSLYYLFQFSWVQLWNQHFFVNHTPIHSWNQLVFSNERKVSCSRKQREPLMGLELTTDRYPLTRCPLHHTPLFLLVDDVVRIWLR